MANGDQQFGQVSDSELFEDDEEEQQEQQSDSILVSDEELFGDQDNGQQVQTSQTEQGTVSDNELFGTDEEDESEKVTESEDEEEGGILDTIVDAAQFFIPKEDPEESSSSLDFGKSRGIKQGIGDAIRMLGNIPEMFAQHSQTVANLWQEAHETQQKSDQERRRELLDMGLSKSRVDRIIKNRKKLRNDPEKREKIEAGRKIFQEISRGQQQSAEQVESTIKNYASTWSEPTPSKLHKANDIWDWVEPNRLYDVFATQAPLTGFLGAAYLSNPYAGAAAMYGVEGGAALDAIEKMEQRGVEVDPTVKFMATHATGAGNMTLEKFGIDKMVGASKRAAVGRKLLNIGFGALAEGGTEALQEGNSAINEEVAKHIDGVNFDKSIIPDDLGERMIKGLYGGLVIGGGISMTSGALGELAKPSPNDAEVLRFERDDQGSLSPVFRVTKPGHERELEEVSLSEISEMNDVQTPNFRLDKLVEEAENVGMIEDDQMGNIVKNLIRGRASKENVSAEEWVYENIESIVSGSKVNKNDLLQEVQRSIDEIGTDIDLEIGDTPEAGGLRPALLDGEGRMYIGREGQSPSEIASRYDVPLNRVTQGYSNSQGRFIGNQRAKQFVRENSDIVAESALKTIEDNGVMTDPNVEQTPLSERSLIGEEATDDLTRALREASLLDRAQNLRSWFENSKITKADGSPMIAYHGTRGDFNTFNRENAKVTTDDGFYGEGFYFTDSNKLASYFANQAVGDVGPNVMPMYLKITNPFEITRDMTAGEMIRELGIEDFARQRLEEAGWRNIAEEGTNPIDALDSKEFSHGSGVGGGGMVDVIMNLIGSKRFKELLIREGYDGVIAPSTDEVISDAKEYVAFNKDQMKSAVGNRGTFDPSNPSTLMQREGEVKGAVNFDGGRAVIKAFDSADFTTMLHELAHVFRRSLNESELNEIMETMESDTEKGWTREAEEEFADRFMEWAEGGEISDSVLEKAFRIFRSWLINVVGNLSDSENISLSNEQQEFFNNMFDEIQNEANQIESTPKRFGFLSEWADKLMKALDVEKRFRDVGLSESGFHIKNYFSVQQVYTQEGVDLEVKIARLLGGDQDKQVEAVLAAESPRRIEELREEGKDDIADAAEEMRNYFDKSQAEYQARGAEGVDFKRRILSELDSRLKRAEELGEVEKATNLRNRFQEIQENFEFVSIPFNHWFQSEIESNIEGALELMELIANKYKRNTVKIQDLIDQDIINREDITTKSIIESYSVNKAKDMALLNIRQAAIEEGGMVPIEEGQDYKTGYHRPPSGAIVFEGYQVRDVIGDWIRSQLTKNDELGAWKSFFNKVKMAAFWNPFFLPMYDVLQSTMAGATQFMRPIRTANLYKNALNDVLNRTEEFYAAERNGISSKPYNSPYKEISRQFLRASKSYIPESSSGFLKATESIKNYAMESMSNVLKEFGELQGIDWIKTLGGSTIPLRAVYQTSWDTAWYLDRLVRQVTYRHFKQEGFTDREAAQKAAKTHADYASVPPNTRRTLNSIFFTPTFKIAMGKWFADSLRSVGNVLQGNANLDQRQLASVAVRTVGILAGFDMMMLSLGFDRDEFGRRYVRPADTDKGQKELVITWTGPHNLFLKYAQRVENAVTDPTVTNVGKRLLQQHSWELHPVYRIGNSLVNNRTPGGEKIYYGYDPPENKLAKSVTYAVNSSIALVAQLNEEQAFGEKGAKVFAREYGKLLEVATKPFIFKYTRQPKEIRIKNQIKMLKSIADEEIGAQRLARKILSSNKDTEEVIKEFKKGLKDRAQNFSRRMKETIQKLEESHYDRTNDPTINQPHYPQNSEESNPSVPDSALFDQ